MIEASRRQFLRALGSSAAAVQLAGYAGEAASLLAASPPLPSGAIDLLLDRFYPLTALLVTVAQRAQLQTLLDQHGTIRLVPGNYAVGGPGALVLSSGQRIHGPGIGCILPPIEVAAGCTGALVSGVTAELRFMQAGASVRGNVFRRVTYGSVRVQGATLEDNLFIDKYLGRWRIDNSASGFMARNRIVRTTCQQPEDAFVWQGDPTGASRGNAVLWANHLTPANAKFVLSDLPDLRILNYDCEAPGSNGSPAIDARSVARLYVFGTTGTSAGGAAVRVASGDAWVHQSMLYNQDPAGSTLDLAGAGSAIRTLFEATRPAVAPTGGALLSAFPTGSATPTVATNPAVLSAAQRAGLTQLAVPPLRGAYTLPSLRAIPGEAPPNQVSPMGRSHIQALLDSQGMVVLDPGVYVLDGPLVLGRQRGLIGSGMDQTYLVAANPTIDLIIDANTPPSAGDTSQSQLLLTELTLQGGRRGISHSLRQPAAFKLMFTNSMVSHVCIRDMAEAGWMFEELFGYDNNCFEQVLFVNCPVGFKQLATHTGTEATEPRLAYMDKNVFFRCQWHGCERALELTAIRASGGNMWFECAFVGSKEFVARARNHNNLLFVGCDFDANKGDPLLAANGHLMVVASRWRAVADAGPTSFADSMIDVTLEGCDLSAVLADTPLTNGAGTSFDLRNPDNQTTYANRRFHLFHNRARQVTLGNIPHATLINNDVGPVPETARWAYRLSGATQVLDATAPTPGSRLMCNES